MEINWDNTERGFRKGRFVDRYNDPCTIQKSSLATEDCIWLGRDNGFGEPMRMHLTREMATDLANMLLYFACTGELP